MAKIRVSWTLKRDLEHDNGELTAQLIAQIRRSIVARELRPGDRLPASRVLALELGVARGTVTTALETLVAEGLLQSRAGSGTYVSDDAARYSELGLTSLSPNVPSQADLQGAISRSVRVLSPEIDAVLNVQIDFRPCRPSLEAFPNMLWRRCLARAGSTSPSPDYGDPRGDLGLRQTLVNYLRRARGLMCSVDQIIITNGALHAMQLLSATCLDAGAKVVVENPGYRLARQCFQLAGASVHGCAVDDSGLVVDQLPHGANNIRLVCVTPSHQFPTGIRLSLGRRHDLIRWAEERDALILEDDYDGEFRYDIAPLAPMAALSNRCVVYCGTFSKTMFPGLRIGFAVAPKPLIEALAAYRTITEYAPNSVLQTALAHFIEAGHYEKHIHTMRRIYARKRKLLADALKQSTFAAELKGLDSGLNAFVQLRPGLSGTALSEKALGLGIDLPPTRRYAMDDSVPDDSVIFGYGGLTLDQIERGVALLNRC